MAVTPATSRGGGSGALLDYAERITDLAVVATAEATPNLVVALPARVYDGATVIWLEFYCAGVQVGTGASANIVLNLWDASTDLTRWAQFQTSAFLGPVLTRRKLTPSAASHTYQVQAWRTVADGSLECAPPHLPCYIAAYTAA